jgi:hypothetical protein
MAHWHGSRIRTTTKRWIYLYEKIKTRSHDGPQPELKEWFEKATQQRFDVTMLGQATRYLQSRITQLADYSIILDQSRYAALVTTRYLLPLNHDGIKLQRKAMYASPLPALPAFTKNDCSDNYAAVMRLQEEFNFEYAAAIGSLIWLMNTFVKLCFAFRKLEKVYAVPRKASFRILASPIQPHPMPSLHRWHAVTDLLTHP